MRTHARLDFDLLMREIMFLGVAGLLIWSLTGVVGLVFGFLTVSPQATLRFLLAVLVLVFSRRTYWELREWRWRKLPADERFGFASPLWEHARAGEHVETSDTEAQHPQG